MTDVSNSFFPWNVLWHYIRGKDFHMGIFVYFHRKLFYTGLLNILFILDLNSEFMGLRLWDQKQLFKQFVLEILLEYF